MQPKPHIAIHHAKGKKRIKQAALFAKLEFEKHILKLSYEKTIKVN